MQDKTVIYYMYSTHWDREWYLPFQGFRYELVKTIDGLIEKLESDKKLSLFTLDGQTVVLKDYKEIAGERADKLKSLIAQGRVAVGPWYVMPDEFLVSGESLIRNLLFGEKTAHEWGAETFKYGYVNDVFGHIAQMPQIFSGFGIHGAYLGRGAGNDEKFSHFLWESPDGTSCITYLGYYGGFLRDFVVCNFGKPDFEACLKEYIENEASKTAIPVILIMDTDDHRSAQSCITDIQDKIKELYPNAVLKNISLEKMVEELDKYKALMPVKKGELNKVSKNENATPDGNLSLVTNSLSSYYPLKKNNDFCQNLLEKRLEPMLIMGKLIGKPMDREYINLAYDYLLKCHPHDSICGCSVDRTHEDMYYRFNQVKNIEEALTFDFVSEYNSEYSSGDYCLTLYNFDAYPEKRTVTAEIELDYGFACENVKPVKNEPYKGFKIFDSAGKEVPYQVVHIDYNARKRLYKQKSVGVHKYTVCFTDTLPAFGMTQYKIVPYNKERIVYSSNLISGDDYAENDYVRLTITENGELELFDKQTKVSYKNLNRFSDNGEYGDGWWHIPPINDTETSSKTFYASTEKISQGSECVTFKVTKAMRVPAFFDEYAHERSKETVELVISSLVTLYRENKYVIIETTVENNAKDHRLRLKIPTGIQADEYFAGQAFYKAVRKTDIPEEHKKYYEAEVPEKNFNGIVGVCAGANGLAFVSAEGLHECGVTQNGEIGITLIRSFHKVFMEQNAIKSQIQGKHTFKYALVPMNDKTEYSDLLRIQNTLSLKPITAFCKKESVLKSTGSLIEINNKNLHCSIIKFSEDNKKYLIRLFNATDIKQSGKISLGFDISEAAYASLDEKEYKKAESDGNSINVTAEPWQIVTILFK